MPREFTNKESALKDYSENTLLYFNFIEDEIEEISYRYFHFYGRYPDYRLTRKLNSDKTFPTPIKSGLTRVDLQLQYQTRK